MAGGGHQFGERHGAAVGGANALGGIVYEVLVEAEASVLQCEITDLVDEQSKTGAWSSDWDAHGYRELEFRVVSGQWLDPDGTPHDLGMIGCAEVVDRYAEFIEEELWAPCPADSMKRWQILSALFPEAQVTETLRSRFNTIFCLYRWSTLSISEPVGNGACDNARTLNHHHVLFSFD